VHGVRDREIARERKREMRKDLEVTKVAVTFRSPVDGIERKEAEVVVIYKMHFLNETYISHPIFNKVTIQILLFRIYISILFQNKNIVNFRFHKVKPIFMFSLFLFQHYRSATLNNPFFNSEL
jgi:hypothetical protein